MDTRSARHLFWGSPAERSPPSVSAGAHMSTMTRERTKAARRRTAPIPVSTATEALTPPLPARGTTYAAVQQCLAVQRAAPPRTPLARLLGRNPLHADAIDSYRGALGELAVRQELERLGSQWTVLSGVPIGAHDADIDYVVLGPGGIFTLTVKDVTDAAVWIGGRTAIVDDQPTDFVRRAQSEGASAARSLSRAAGGPVQITPLLVVSKPSRLTLRDPAVEVVTAKDLIAWFRSRRRVNSPEAVAYYAMVAAEPDTWQLAQSTVEVTLRHLQRFERLRREVDTAARRRRALRIACGVALLGTLLKGPRRARSRAALFVPAPQS